eukprot:s4256_g1.t1
MARLAPTSLSVALGRPGVGQVAAPSLRLAPSLPATPQVLADRSCSPARVLLAASVVWAVASPTLAVWSSHPDGLPSPPVASRHCLRPEVADDAALVQTAKLRKDDGHQGIYRDPSKCNIFTLWEKDEEGKDVALMPRTSVPVPYW